MGEARPGRRSHRGAATLAVYVAIGSARLKDHVPRAAGF
jgi:hypothetical protein